jgi:hypothetical protein
VFQQKWAHSLQHLRQQRRGGIRVQVDSRHPSILRERVLRKEEQQVPAVGSSGRPCGAGLPGMGRYSIEAYARRWRQAAGPLQRPTVRGQAPTWDSQTC